MSTGGVKKKFLLIKLRDYKDSIYKNKKNSNHPLYLQRLLLEKELTYICVCVCKG